MEDDLRLRLVDEVWRNMYNLGWYMEDRDVKKMWDTVVNDVPALREFCAKQIGK